MPRNLKSYRVFIGSPSGLEDERGTLCKVIEDYNRMEATPRGLHYCIVRWEDIPSTYGRPQDVINSELKGCDYYILILWKRWGTSPGETGGGRYDSGTEEEFHLAERCVAEKTMSGIAVYFKTIESDDLTDTDDQLKKVVRFREDLEINHTLLYGKFSDMEEFQKCMRMLLAKWTRENEEPIPSPQRTVLDFGNPSEDSYSVN